MIANVTLLGGRRAAGARCRVNSNEKLPVAGFLYIIRIDNVYAFGYN